MAIWIDLAHGRFNEKYETLYCECTTREYKGKQYFTNVYNADTKNSEQQPVELVMRNLETGEEVKVQKFQVVTNKNAKEDWHPSHIVKVKIET